MKVCHLLSWRYKVQFAHLTCLGIVKRLAIRRSWTPSTNTAIVNRQHQKPPRNTTSSNKKKRQSLPPSASNTRTPPTPARPVINHTKTSMARTLSRSSSPAVMVSPSSSPTISRNTTRPPSRASSLRRSITPQQSESPPRWR